MESPASIICPWKPGRFCNSGRWTFSRVVSIVSNAILFSPKLCAQTYHAAFLSTLVKDIRSERPKITEKDHLRLLYVSKWFLEFFLALHSKQTAENDGKDKQDLESKCNFGLVAEVTEREWIGWVFKRMREAVEEKACFLMTRSTC